MHSILELCRVASNESNNKKNSVIVQRCIGIRNVDLTPLTGQWVLVSPGRQDRPWTGHVDEEASPIVRHEYDAGCALCPDNLRATGERNPNYRGVYVFDNDFPALGETGNNSERDECAKLFVSEVEQGTCRVVCFTENHSRTLAQMSTIEILSVVNGFQEETAHLLANPDVRHIQIFENRGPMMGCSNPHPHAQVWAQGRVPSIPAREIAGMQDYLHSHSENMLLEYLAEERRRGERIVLDNGEFAVIVPYWATWPFETIIIPEHRSSWLTDLSASACEALADAISGITVRYDNLFRTDFPYSAGIHQQAVTNVIDPAYQMHMHFYPPLLRSATIRKFMVGYEMLAEPQRDLSPEEAAAILRGQSDVHYLDCPA